MVKTLKLNERLIPGGGDGTLNVAFWVWPEVGRRGAFALKPSFDERIHKARSCRSFSSNAAVQLYLLGCHAQFISGAP